ncbi:hypothetical protein GGQ64_002961 [Rhizobium azooxidifex]|uniref:Uncharacterized protein n=1 Tax=Mycoplana azooxidifex TaxID=1636188 RepID=A0A7W6GJY4_9HYPH|nr:hypothetical protein [Mycoplana azooxidifex]MBB3977747.1 hypothetical protein [Mycoplana azooxidifex]
MSFLFPPSLHALSVGDCRRMEAAVSGRRAEGGAVLEIRRILWPIRSVLVKGVGAAISGSVR